MKIVLSLFLCLLVVSAQSQKLIKFEEKNGKEGFKDEEGNEVIPAMYEVVADFTEEEERALVYNGLGGFIDKKGNEVIPLKYEKANSFKEGRAMVKLKKKWGFIDKNGNEIVPVMYEEAYDFSEGLAAVKLNNKWGFVDKSGKIAIPIIYQDERDQYNLGTSMAFSEGLCRVKLNDKWGFIDKDGKEVIPIKYQEVRNFSEGLAAFRPPYKEWSPTNKLWGFIDAKGVEVIPPKYNEVFYYNGFANGVALVRLDKWGFIDKTGKEIISLKYDNINYHFSSNSYFPFNSSIDAKLNGKYGLIDQAGKEIIPFKYDELNYQKEGYFKARIGNKWKDLDLYGKEYKPVNTSNELIRVQVKNKWGYNDADGKKVVGPVYDEALDFSEGLAAVRLNDKWGFIDRNGKVILPFQYDKAESFSYGYAVVKGIMDGKASSFGVINKNGELVYHSIESFNEGRAKVSFNRKYGFIDKSGKEVVPLKYDDAKAFNNGLAKVKIGNYWGMINREGIEVFPIRFHEFEKITSEGIIKVKLNGKYGYVDKNGNEITQIKYDDVRKDVEKNIIIELDGKLGYLNESGKEVLYDSVGQLAKYTRIGKINGKYRILNSTGYEELPFELLNYRRGFKNDLFILSDKGWQLLDKETLSLDPTVYRHLMDNGELGVVLLGETGSLSYCEYDMNLQRNLEKLVCPKVVPPAEDEQYYHIMPKGLILFVSKKTKRAGIKSANGKVLVQPYFSSIFPDRIANEIYRNKEIENYTYEFITPKNVEFEGTINPATLTIKGHTDCSSCSGGYNYTDHTEVVKGQTNTYNTSPVQKLKSERFDMRTGTWIQTYTYGSEKVTTTTADKTVTSTTKTMCKICKGEGFFTQVYKWNGTDYIVQK